MLENRSFDHMLGFSGLTGTDAETGKPTAIDGLKGNEANTLDGKAYRVQRGADTVMRHDPGHEFSDVLTQLCGPGSAYPRGGAYHYSCILTGAPHLLGGKEQMNLSGVSIETTLELWASSLRDVKARMRPLFTQQRVAASASLFLDGLLGSEPRKTGWMRAEAAGDPGPVTLVPGASRPSLAAVTGMPMHCATSCGTMHWRRWRMRTRCWCWMRPGFSRRA